MTKTKKAVIIGNGKSRQSIDLEELRPVGEFYGTNGCYRDMDLDWLVAIDEKMIGEIFHSSFPVTKFIVPPFNEQFESSDYSPFRRRANAGMLAMNEAIKRDCEILYCFGFDFMLDEPGLNTANIYDGTPAYGPETRASVDDCINRVKYMDWFAGQNPETQFIFIYPESLNKIPLRTNIKSPNILVSYIS